MSDAEFAIVARGLTRRFGALTAVNKMSFTLMPGEVLGIVGGVVEPITSTARPIAAVSTSNLLLHLRSDSGVSLSGSAVTGWASTVGSHTAAPQTQARGRRSSPVKLEASAVEPSSAVPPMTILSAVSKVVARPNPAPT